MGAAKAILKLFPQTLLKHSFICLVLLTACFICNSAQAKTARLFILSGQSNAAGLGNGDLLPAQWQTEDPEVLLFRNTNLGWQPLAPYNRVSEPHGIENTAFGAELLFSKELKNAYPDDIIAVAKVAIRGGTSIVAWDKNWDRADWTDDLIEVDNLEVADNPLYDLLIAGANTAKDLLLLYPGVDDVVVSGFLWLQAERDSKLESTVLAYEQRLTDLINNVREDLAAPDMPVMVMDAHLQNEQLQLFQTTLRSVRDNMSQVLIVECEDLPTHEGVHFNTEGMITLGIRFATAYLSAQTAATDPNIDQGTMGTVSIEAKDISAETTENLKKWIYYHIHALDAYGNTMPDEDLRYEPTVLPKNGKLYQAGTVTEGVRVNDKPRALYTPNPGFFGTDFFKVKATTADGTVISNAARIFINVFPDVSDTPGAGTIVIQDTNVTTNENTKIWINYNVTATDASGSPIPTENLRFAVSFPQTGKVYQAGTVIDGVRINNKARALYTPNTDFFGRDSFTVKVYDVNGTILSNTATMTIDVIHDPAQDEWWDEATEDQEQLQWVQLPPKISDEVYLINPGMGWYTSAKPWVDFTEIQQTERFPYYPSFHRMHFNWAELNPAPGVYDFSKINEHIAKAAQGNQKFMFKLVTADYRRVIKPNGTVYLRLIKGPQWLRDLGVNGWEFFRTNQNEDTTPPTLDEEWAWMPDYADPVVKEHMFALIRELGRVFANNPMVDHMGIGLFGVGGAEWNTGGTIVRELVNSDLKPWQKAVPMPGVETVKEYLAVFKEAFPDMPMHGNHRPDDYTAAARLYDFGSRSACMGDWGLFGPNWNFMTNVYPNSVAEGGDIWMRGPLTAEPCNTYQAQLALDSSIEDFKKTMQFLFKQHFSTYNNKNGVIPVEFRPLTDIWIPKLGYRYIIRQMEHSAQGQNLAVKFTVSNIGSAPRYGKGRNFVAFRLKDANDNVVFTKTTDIDVTAWLPGYFKDVDGKYCAPGYEYSLEPDEQGLLQNPDPDCSNWIPGDHDIYTQFLIPEDLAPGDYSLSIGIVDLRTGDAVIQFAHENPDASRWLNLANVSILEGAQDPTDTTPVIIDSLIHAASLLAKTTVDKKIWINYSVSATDAQGQPVSADGFRFVFKKLPDLGKVYQAASKDDQGNRIPNKPRLLYTPMAVGSDSVEVDVTHIDLPGQIRTFTVMVAVTGTFQVEDIHLTTPVESKVWANYNVSSAAVPETDRYYKIVAQPASGRVYQARDKLPDGSGVPTKPRSLYTPNPGFTGIDKYEVQVYDVNQPGNFASFWVYVDVM